MKARVLKSNYYVIATAMIKDSQVVSVDLQRYATEQQAENDFYKWRKKYPYADIYKYVDGVFDTSYFNPIATRLTADSEEFKMFGYDMTVAKGTEENDSGVYENANIHIIVD